MNKIRNSFLRSIRSFSSSIFGHKNRSLEVYIRCWKLKKETAYQITVRKNPSIRVETSSIGENRGGFWIKVEAEIEKNGGFDLILKQQKETRSMKKKMKVSKVKGNQFYRQQPVAHAFELYMNDAVKQAPSHVISHVTTNDFARWNRPTQFNRKLI